MPSRCPPEVRRQVLQLAGAGSKPKDLAEAFGGDPGHRLQLAPAGTDR